MFATKRVLAATCGLLTLALVTRHIILQSKRSASSSAGSAAAALTIADLYLNQYCTVTGLTDEPELNGKECFVAKIIDAAKTSTNSNPSTIDFDAAAHPDSEKKTLQQEQAEQQQQLCAVLLSVEGPINAVTDAYLYLKPENLIVKYDVAIRPSRVSSVSAVGGNGLFATRAYRKGEVIFVERPMAEIPNTVLTDALKQQVNTTVTDNNVSSSVSSSSSTKTAFETTIRSYMSAGAAQVLEGLSVGSSRQPQFKELMASHGPWMLRIKSNASGDANSRHMYPLTSRMNHCCAFTKGCNVIVRPPPSSSTQAAAAAAMFPPTTTTVTASRGIAAGEELLCDYIFTTMNVAKDEQGRDSPQKKNARAERLLNGFGIVEKCSCVRCDTDVCGDAWDMLFHPKALLHPDVPINFETLLKIIRGFHYAFDFFTTKQPQGLADYAKANDVDMSLQIVMLLYRYDILDEICQSLKIMMRTCCEQNLAEGALLVMQLFENHFAVRLDCALIAAFGDKTSKLYLQEEKFIADLRQNTQNLFIKVFNTD